ncbi:MAG: GTPase ObgE [Synergistales bacterium]|nr:GTPase ObgE [Synergistales bacterium]
MRFLDQATIKVKAGRGGNGCLSFRREKYVPKGGPDGGNGGHGGSVILQGNRGLLTLADFSHATLFSAEHGGNGRGKKQHGKQGEDAVIEVPCGTSVYDKESGSLLADIVEHHEQVCVALGGRGGRGNAHFANSIRKTPRFSEKGEPGQERGLQLELHLIADIGLLGVPNVGKSSLLAAISNAHPKIGSYPFTTLTPNLGVLETEERRVTVADLPGLVEKAHDDVGLGLRFLRHISRTKILLYVVDISLPTPEEVVEQWRTVQQECHTYDSALGNRPSVVVANKFDAAPSATHVQKVLDAFDGLEQPALTVSAWTGYGLADLSEALVSLAAQYTQTPASPGHRPDATKAGAGTLRHHAHEAEAVSIEPCPEGYRVRHHYLERIVQRYDFEQDEAVFRFNKLLKKHKVEEKLRENGAVPGETIMIGDVSFAFQPEGSYTPDAKG